jgi:hypothetical protein
MMVGVMKWIALLLCSFPALAGLTDVKSVYLLPMTHGMDQYLANHLVKAGVYQVVTDPKRADAVFTDRLGDALETRLKEFYPEPKPEEGKKAEAQDSSSGPASKDVTEYAGAPTRVSSFSASKGNLFLVDVKSRAVLWSIHARPKHNTPAELDKTAAHVVKTLDEALHPKPKK